MEFFSLIGRRRPFNEKGVETREKEKKSFAPDRSRLLERCQICFFFCKIVLRGPTRGRRNVIFVCANEIQLWWFALRGSLYSPHVAMATLFRTEHFTCATCWIFKGIHPHPTLNVDTRRTDGERWRPTSLMPSRQEKVNYICITPLQTRGV